MSDQCTLREVLLADMYEEKIDRLTAELKEARGLNQSLAVDWVKFNDMKSALEFFARLNQDMLIMDVNRIAKKALRMGDL